MSDKIKVVVSRDEVESYVERLNAIYGRNTPVKFRLKEYKQNDDFKETVDCPFSILAEYELPELAATEIRAESKCSFNGKSLSQLRKSDFDQETLESFPPAVAFIMNALAIGCGDNGDSLLAASYDTGFGITKRADSKIIYYTQTYNKSTKVLVAQLEGEKDKGNLKKIALSSFEALVVQVEKSKDIICDFIKLLMHCQKEVDYHIGSHTKFPAQLGEYKGKLVDPTDKEGFFGAYPELQEMLGNKPIELSIATAIRAEYNRRTGQAIREQGR